MTEPQRWELYIVAGALAVIIGALVWTFLLR